MYSLFVDDTVDAFCVTGATNRRYFSGWTADDHVPDRPAGVMLIQPSSRQLFSSPTNLPWAAAEARPDVEVLQTRGTWQSTLAGEAKRSGVKRLGFEDAVLPVAAWRTLQDELGQEIELVPLGDALDVNREVKSPEELEHIEAALAITDEVMQRAAAHLHGGLTELDLAKYIDQQFRDLGSEGNAFDTIVASGPNAAKPHHAPGDREIEDGDPVIIDIGGKIQGYCGDLTRTIWAGQPGEQLGTMYLLVAEAQRAAFAAIKGGAAASDVDQAARSVFAQAGYGELFVHGVGHSLGLRIHESPFMNQTSNAILAPGNVITVEPGIYDPDWGGVRIEDVVLVTENGYRNLTHAPKLLGVETERESPARRGESKGNT